jgi:hypothetical protein
MIVFVLTYAVLAVLGVSVLGSMLREQSRFADMKSQLYDVVRKEGTEGLVLLEAVADLNTAESKIHELASYSAGEFQAIDQHSQNIDKHAFKGGNRKDRFRAQNRSWVRVVSLFFCSHGVYQPKQ